MSNLFSPATSFPEKNEKIKDVTRNVQNFSHFYKTPWPEVLIAAVNPERLALVEEIQLARAGKR